MHLASHQASQQHSHPDFHRASYQTIHRYLHQCVHRFRHRSIHRFTRQRLLRFLHQRMHPFRYQALYEDSYLALYPAGFPRNPRLDWSPILPILKAEMAVQETAFKSHVPLDPILMTPEEFASCSTPVAAVAREGKEV
jgi:hypothetical protein